MLGYQRSYVVLYYNLPSRGEKTTPFRGSWASVRRSRGPRVHRGRGGPRADLDVRNRAKVPLFWPDQDINSSASAKVEGSSWRLSQAMSIATVANRRTSAPMLPGSRVSAAMDNAKNHDFVFQHEEEQAVRESSNECASNLAMDARVSRWEF